MRATDRVPGALARHPPPAALRRTPPPPPPLPSPLRLVAGLALGAASSAAFPARGPSTASTCRLFLYESALTPAAPGLSTLQVLRGIGAHFFRDPRGSLAHPPGGFVALASFHPSRPPPHRPMLDRTPSPVRGRRRAARRHPPVQETPSQSSNPLPCAALSASRRGSGLTNHWASTERRAGGRLGWFSGRLRRTPPGASSRRPGRTRTSPAGGHRGARRRTGDDEAGARGASGGPGAEGSEPRPVPKSSSRISNRRGERQRPIASSGVGAEVIHLAFVLRVRDNITWRGEHFPSALDAIRLSREAPGGKKPAEWAEHTRAEWGEAGVI